MYIRRRLNCLVEPDSDQPPVREMEEGELSDSTEDGELDDVEILDEGKI